MKVILFFLNLGIDFKSIFSNTMLRFYTGKIDKPELLNKSFSHMEETENDNNDKGYYSDNESRKKSAYGKIKTNTPKDNFIYFVEESIKLERKLHKFINLLNKQERLRTAKPVFEEHARSQEQKKSNNRKANLKKDNALYKASIREHNPYLKANIKRFEDKYIKHDKLIQEKLPLLIEHNIPMLEAKYNINRSKLYELYIQFKVLTKLSLAINDNELEVLGIDFKTFFKGIPEMRVESEDLVKIIFDRMNGSRTNLLSWEEFLKTIKKIKSDILGDKIDMFFDVSECLFNEYRSRMKMIMIYWTSVKFRKFVICHLNDPWTIRTLRS
jgi:hypothetical protein